MLKKEVTYEDFDGKTVTETFYFNLSKPELVEMEVEYQEGFAAHIQRIIDAKDNKTLIKEFKEIVLKAYGEKSEDGRRFMKSPEMAEAFSQTAAYQEIFMSLAMDDGEAAAFINGILPKDLVEAGKQMELAQKAEAPKKTTSEIAAEMAAKKAEPEA